MQAPTPKEIAFDALYGNVKEDDKFFNMSEYMTQAARTGAATYHPDLAPRSVLLDAISGVKAVSGKVDQIKKAMAYGKDTPELEFERKVVGADSYRNIDMDLVHAILGIYTEAAELLEILEYILLTRDHDLEEDEHQEIRKKLLNEAGDGLWYEALLFKTLGTDFVEVGNLNIDKLRKRYPVKFTEDLAVNRDEAKENVVFD